MAMKNSSQDQVSADSTATQQLPALDYNIYKNHTKFWRKAEWQEYKRSEQGRTQLDGIAKGSGSLAHLQDHDGQALDATTSSAIRDSARAMFRQFVHDGNPPSTWGNALPAQRDRFQFQMESRHPILRYCEPGGWKATQTASVLYPSFKLSEKRKLGDGKLLPKWLMDVKDHGEDIEELQRTADDSADTVAPQSRKRKGPPKVVVAEPSRAQKRREALQINDPL